MGKIRTDYAKHYVRQATRFLENAYRVDRNTALSIIGKVRYDIAKKAGATNVGNIYAQKGKIGDINRLVYETLKGDYNLGIKTKIVDNKPITTYTGTSDVTQAFREYTEERMYDFIEKYKNVDSFNKIYNAFFIDKTMDYQEFKKQIENFKRSDPTYAKEGS